MDASLIEKQIVEETVKATIELVQHVSKSIGFKIKETISINHAIKNYVENYLQRYGKIKVLGMSRPVPLQALYVNVEVQQNTHLHSYETIEGLQTKFVDKAYRRFRYLDKNRESGVDVANKEKYLNILGAPGAGKSTFLKKMGLEALLPKSDSNIFISKYQHNCLPVYIDLKQFKNEEIDLIQIITKEFFYCNFPESESFILKCLQSGKLLILLDGLDEVPSDKIDQVITHIQDFSNKYKKNRYITSCRTAFYKNYFTSFYDVEVSNFDDNQIKAFACNWFSNENDKTNNTCNEFIAQLYDPKHFSTLELAQTPLLLTFLCLVYDNSSQFPVNRSALYKQALYILLEKWAAEKRVHNDEIYQDLHIDLEVELLSEIACGFYINNQLFFSKDELANSINNYLATLLNINKKLNTSKIIEAIEVHQGLLVQRASDIYSFSHLTIQEYLTSYYFLSQTKIDQLVDQYLFDPKWREIFLMLAGMNRVDYLLEQCVIKLQKFKNENKNLIFLLDWANRAITPSDNPENDLAHRIFVLAFPLSYIREPGGLFSYSKNSFYQDIAYNLASRIDNYIKFKHYKNLNRDRARKLIHSISYFNFIKIKTEDVLSEINLIESNPIKRDVGANTRQNRDFQKAILKAMGMDVEYFKPGFVKYGPVIQYLEVCDFIFDIKKEAMSITKNTWDNVCNQLAV